MELTYTRHFDNIVRENLSGFIVRKLYLLFLTLYFRTYDILIRIFRNFP